MKSVIYINKNKVWFDGRAYDWSWETLAGIFSAIKKDLHINDVRIVLGSNVSYVVNFKLEDVSKARRVDVLKISKGWFPFVLTDDCFDWRMVTLSESDIWAQVIAIEPSLLNSLTEAITKSGIKVDWIIPVGVVLGSVTVGKEVPIIVRWKGKEELSVLAQNGLVDYVGTDNDEVINSYAKQKWHLAVNPEQMLLKEDNFDFNALVLGSKNRGDDEDILGLSLLKQKNQGVEDIIPKSLESLVGISEVLNEEQVESKRLIRPWLIVLLIISMITLGVILWWRYGRAVEVVSPESPVLATPTTTEVPEASPSSAVLINFSPYKVQVLNGSGVTGAAGVIRDKLVELGFEDVVIGNAPSVVEQTVVSYKSDIPAEVLAQAMDTVSDHEIGNVLFLTNDVIYDLVIVIGSSVKN